MSDDWDKDLLEDDENEDDLEVEGEIANPEPLTEGAGFYLEILHDVIERIEEIPEITGDTLDLLRELHTRMNWGPLHALAWRISRRTIAYCGAEGKVRPRAGLRRARRFREETCLDLSLMMAHAPDGDLFSILRGNCSQVAGIFGLTPHEERLLLIVAVSTRVQALDSILDTIMLKARSWNRSLRVLLSSPITDAERIAAGEGKIFKSGLVDFDGDDLCFSDIFELNHRVNLLLEKEGMDEAEIISRLLVPQAKPKLCKDDIPHLSAEVDLCRRTLEGALQAGRTGINIFLYGPPGTGKTEIAKLMSSLAGANTYFIGEAQEYDVELDRKDRMQDLRTAQALLKGNGSSIIVFDEMEDMTVFDVGEGSKIVMNRLLETNDIPVIWIANDPRRIPDYLIRRMTLAFEIPVPTPAVQKAILKKIGAEQGLDIADIEADRLQKMSDIVPGLARNVVQASLLSGNHKGDLEIAWSGLQQAMTGRKSYPGRTQVTEVFRPDLSVADTDLVALTERMRGRGIMRVSFCFYGPPGTGKSAFARHVSEAMGLRIIEKKGSDILGPYVGETERNIALAFEQARDEGASLIFDEIDSLLTDRGKHSQSWETSQVNEMLKAFESHPCPFFGCTNLMSGLDQAALRRFLFKVKFQFLGRIQAEGCWRHYFGTEPPTGVNLDLDLVPADFGIVKAKCEILGIDSDEERVKMLRAESEGRGARLLRIGFGRAIDG